jgi:hypothetical protein
MNIFYLSNSPKECAEMHCDRHVVKMIIEYAQLMSTAHRVLDGEEYIDTTSNGRKIKRWRMKDERYENGLMKASHVNHPSNIWARSNNNNYMWLYYMWRALCLEYTHRYGKHHACEKYAGLIQNIPKNISLEYNKTEPPPAMPDYCKVPGNSIASYHKYYINEKVRFARWTNREIPLWFREGALQRMVEENERLGLYEDASVHI